MSHAAPFWGRRRILLALGLSAAGHPAIAAVGVARPTQAPPTLPPAVQARAPAPLRLAGHGRLTFLGLSAYDASLWVPPEFRASQFSEHPFVLELHYLRKFSRNEIARASLDQMKRHGPIDSAQAERWRNQLAQLLPDVRKGEHLAGLHLPGRGLAFFHEGQAIGEVDDPRFAKLFFSIWLGEATSAPALRKALLAGTSP